MQSMVRAGSTPSEVHKWLTRARARKSLSTPTVDNVRRALAGQTYKRSKVETRGRHKKMTALRLKKACLGKKLLGQLRI